MGTFLLILCAVLSMAVSLAVTVFYKRIRGRFRNDKYKLPDNIPLFQELTDIPDKNKFIRSSCLLDTSAGLSDTPAEESVVDTLITDESARQSGFSLHGEHLLLECVSANRTEWHEIREFPVIIGKSQDCDVRLVDDHGVNDRHGFLYTKDGRYFYLDLNSIDGSIVDDKLASGVTELGNGSRVGICQTTIRLVLQSGMEN